MMNYKVKVQDVKTITREKLIKTRIWNKTAQCRLSAASTISCSSWKKKLHEKGKKGEMT